MSSIDETRARSGPAARNTEPFRKPHKLVNQRDGRRLTPQVTYHKVPARTGRRLMDNVGLDGYNYASRDASENIAKEVEAKSKLDEQNKITTSGTQQTVAELRKERANSAKSKRAKAATKAFKNLLKSSKK